MAYKLSGGTQCIGNGIDGLQQYYVLMCPGARIFRILLFTPILKGPDLYLMHGFKCNCTQPG